MENTNDKVEKIVSKFDNNGNFAKKLNRNIEVITEYKTANVIKGGNIYISVDSAKAILSSTTKVAPSEIQPTFDIILSDAEYEMLSQCRDILRQFAKGILYTPSEDKSLGDIFKDYL